MQTEIGEGQRARGRADLRVLHQRVRTRAAQHHAGDDRVHADLLRRELHGHRACQRVDRALGGRVGVEPCDAAQRRGGRDVQDRASAGLGDARHGVARGPDERLERDLHDAVPALVAHLDDRAVALARPHQLGGRGVVDQDREPAVALDRHRDGGRDPGLVREVRVHVEGVAARVSDLRLDRLAIVLAAAGHHDARALGCEAERGGAADAARRAGHEGHLSAQPFARRHARLEPSAGDRLIAARGTSTVRDDLRSPHARSAPAGSPGSRSATRTSRASTPRSCG